MDYFPSEVLEHIFNYITANEDRNSISLVCKSWFVVEKWSRKRVLIGNCYALSPERLIARFQNLKSVSLKGKPSFTYMNLVPRDWGGFAGPWIEALAKSYPGLEELRLKRMVVSDESLELISRAFVNFRSLVLVKCEGFTTDGLAAIAANCRFLKELDLQDSEIKDDRGHWLSCFPDTFTSLVSLNFSCLKGKVDMASLEKLLARCPELKKLKLNNMTVPLETILEHAPHLENLCVGSFSIGQNMMSLRNVTRNASNFTSMREFSWLLERNHFALPIVEYHTTTNILLWICEHLTFLDLTCAYGLRLTEFLSLIKVSKRLQRLWVLNTIGDKGLQAVASSCRDLLELRVYRYQIVARLTNVTEEGLIAVSNGCRKLHSLLYFCDQMTNAALINVSKNCPNFTSFRLCIHDHGKADPVTLQPLDEGFGAIVQSCKSLKRLSLSGLLTDQVFLYIGMYAEQLEILSVTFAGNTDTSMGMQYVLNGCKNLQKLEICNSPLGDDVLLEDVGKYETIRSLWMSSCNVTIGGCKTLARKMPRLNVEIINNKNQMVEDPADSQKVCKMYVYRTLDGPRKDMPEHVWRL